MVLSCGCSENSSGGAQPVEKPQPNHGDYYEVGYSPGCKLKGKNTRETDFRGKEKGSRLWRYPPFLYRH
jgi:hypothetical protein